MLRDQKRLDLDEALSVVRDACHGLDYAHRAGVVHRDVKPGNLLVAAESHTTKLADFGIAKASQQTRITQVGSVLGTAAYLSPEQARGEEAGPPSDIYSLGVCAYQFLAGRLPHEYSSLTELALKQQEETVEPITVHRPEVPPELDRAIRVCLAREPEARYASTLEMAQALDAGLGGEVTDATRMLAAAATGIEELDATRALERTEATRALRRTPTHAPTPPPAYRRDPTGVQPAAEPSQADKRARRNKRLGGLFAVLAVIGAIAAVALAFNSSNSNTGPESVDQGDVTQQVDGIKQFLRENTR
jgi:serine/threonine-protein kinase